MTARSTLHGRRALLDELGPLIAEHPVVTLTGPGGVGKTRLARAVADDLDPERFPGGHRFIELAPLDAAGDLASAVAAQAGLDRLEELAASLGREPSLIVVDNCEHVLGSAADLVVRLIDLVPAATVVATSREPLGLPGEFLVPVEPLAVPVADDSVDAGRTPAVELFMERARAAGARLDDRAGLADIGALCRRLDGMPLAIELAAARARTIPPSELLTLVERSLGVLSRRRGDDRHRSLTAAIETSYRALDDQERCCFERLGVLRGPFDLALARAVARPDDVDEFATLDLLDRLVERSLVVIDPDGGSFRYRLLDALRTFALDRLGRERTTITDRFVDVMVARADAIVERSLHDWGADLLIELLALYRSMVSAIDHSIELDEDGDRAFALYQPLWGLVHDSRSVEIEAVGRRMMERWPHGVEPLRAVGTATWSTALLVVGRVDEAGRAAAGVADVDDAMAVFMANRVLAFAASQQGDWTGGVEALERSLDGAKLLGAPSYERILRISLAYMRMMETGDPLVVEELEAIAAEAEASGDWINRILAVQMKARAGLTFGDLEAAKREIELARALLTSIDYPSGAAALTRLDAWLAVADQGWVGGRATVLAAIDEHARLGLLREQAHLHLIRLLAWLALEQGHDPTATELVALAPDIHGFFFDGGIQDPRLGTLVDRGPTGLALRSWGDRLLAARRIVADDPSAPQAGQRSPVSSPVSPSPDGDRAEGGWRRVPAGWELGFGGRAPLMLPAMKGLGDLAVLLARPGVEIHALELMGAVDTGDAGTVIDDTARESYRQRLIALQHDIDEATAANDLERAARAEFELDALVEQLSTSLGLGGRARTAKSAAERARSAVTARIRAAIKRVDEHDAVLGRHLQRGVRTGLWCAYDPEQPVVWAVEFDAR